MTTASSTAPAPAPGASDAPAPPAVPAGFAPLPIRAAQIPLVGRTAPATDPAPVPFVARAGLPPLPIRLPLDWNQDPHGDRNWRAQLNMLRMADGHILAFEQSRDPAFLRWPLALLLDWHRRHVVLRRPSKYGWGDMIVGQRAARLAYVLAAARIQPGIAGPAARALLAWSARVHARRILFVNPVRLSNHVFDDLVGLRALAEVLPSSPWRARIDAFVDTHLPRLLAMQFGERGIHRENSPGYQGFAIGKLKLLVASGWFERHDVSVLLESARGADRWLRLPDGHPVPIGDTDGQPHGPYSPFVSRRTGAFRAAGYYIQRDPGPPAQLPPQPATPPAAHPAAEHVASPLATAHFTFMGSAQAPFHKHNDDLSWHWYDGEPIVTDTGKYAYLTDERRAYAISARAHSTVEIDETDPLPPMLADLVAYPFGGDLLRHVARGRLGTLLSGRVVHHRLGVAHTRTLAYRPGRFVLVADYVEDLAGAFAAAAPAAVPPVRPVTQWTHFAPAIVLERRGPLRFAGRLTDGRRVAIRAAADPLLPDLLPTEPLPAEPLPAEPTRAQVLRGVIHPRRQGWASEVYAELTERDAFGLTVPHRPGRTTRLASVVTLGAPARRLRWIDDGRLRLDLDDERLLLTPDSGAEGATPALRRRPLPPPADPARSTPARSEPS